MNDRKTNEIVSRGRKPWLPLVVLAAALFVWAGLLALGAYLEMGADKPQHDLRKALIILAMMGAFLAFWGVALWQRANRDAKRRYQDHE